MLPIFHFSIERWKYNSEYKVYVSNMGKVRKSKREDLKVFTNKAVIFLLRLKLRKNIE